METSVHSAPADTFQAAGSFLPVHGVADRECEKHGAYQEMTYEIAGRHVPSGCPHCIRERDSGAVRVRIDYAKREAAQARLETLFKQACVPEHYSGASFANYAISPDREIGALQKRAVLVCQKFAENFDVVLSDGGNLLLVGECGTGKTHLACAIANHLMRNGRSCLFIEATTIVSRMVAARSFSSETSPEDILDDLASVDLLVIDEAEEIEGEDARMIMNKVINARYAKRRPSPPTIMISNLPREDLVQKLSAKAIDRLSEKGQKIPFPWKSNRTMASGGTPPWMNNGDR